MLTSWLTVTLTQSHEDTWEIYFKLWVKMKILPLISDEIWQPSVVIPVILPSLGVSGVFTEVLINSNNRTGSRLYHNIL